MSHLRKQVRDAVVSQITGLSTTGARVYANRVDPLDASQVPALTVRNGPEQIKRRALGPNPYVSRSQSVIVTAHASGAAVWDSLDQICQEVEIAMLGTEAALHLGGLALDTELQGIDAPRISGEGAMLVASADMMFTVLLNAREGIPDTAV